MELLERAPVLNELDGVLAATATGGRVVLVAGEAGIGSSSPRSSTSSTGGRDRRWWWSRVLAGPLVREEGILHAELDLDAARARRRLFDPVGHYNRPDVFRLVVDDRPKPALVSLARAGHSPSAT